nr:nuclear transport factor 2 family protein [uncultured Psychroserpens sp.]
MKQYLKYQTLVFVLTICFCLSCKENSNFESKLENETAAKTVLTKHLEAVSNKDLATLKTTLSPKGNMELIQPGLEVIYNVDGFIKFHEEFFEVPNWTFTTKILSMDVGDKIAVATTEILYEEPERNGLPYFNRLTVTYTLEKQNGSWYIIKDHASSIEKTTPPTQI